IEPTHMGVADVDLRYRAAPGARHHGFTLHRISVNTDLLNGVHAPLLQQHFSAHAERTIGGGIHQYRFHAHPLVIGRPACTQAETPPWRLFASSNPLACSV